MKIRKDENSRIYNLGITGLKIRIYEKSEKAHNLGIDHLKIRQCETSWYAFPDFRNFRFSERSTTRLAIFEFSYFRLFRGVDTEIMYFLNFELLCFRNNEIQNIGVDSAESTEIGKHKTSNIHNICINCLKTRTYEKLKTESRYQPSESRK